METIFIPSKNRADNCKFIQHVNELDLNVIVVLEKEDYEAYTERYNRVNYMVLPESNMGIAYVRNFIKEYAKSQGLQYYWMVDDDVTQVYHRAGTKLKKISFDDLKICEDTFKLQANMGMCALEYQQFAWSATKPIVQNTYCDVCVFIRTDIPVQYRPYAEGKEDRDFTMQTIKAGYNVYRSTEFAFAAPKNGSNKGGLKEIFYDISDREELCGQRMVELWGEDICQPITKGDGRKDVKIIWKNINKAEKQLMFF